MPFARKIVRQEKCSRCKADAEVRVDDEHGGMLIMILSCPKCRLRKYVGLTTHRAIKMGDALARMMKARDESPHPAIARSLDGRIERLRDRIAREEMGVV